MVPQEELHAEPISRRQLLKALVAAGGGLTVSLFLPQRWASPTVEVGVLPAHAQISPPPPPQAAIISCTTLNAQDGGNIHPVDTIRTWCDIAPALVGIQIRRVISLNQPGHPQHGVVHTITGPTDVAGRFQPANFDLSTLTPTIEPGENRIIVFWEFVNPEEGTNTCQNNVDIIGD